MTEWKRRETSKTIYFKKLYEDGKHLKIKSQLTKLKKAQTLNGYTD